MGHSGMTMFSKSCQDRGHSSGRRVGLAADGQAISPRLVSVRAPAGRAGSCGTLPPSPRCACSTLRIRPNTMRYSFASVPSIQMYSIPTKSSSPWHAPSRPIPDIFIAPNGASADKITPEDRKIIDDHADQAAEYVEGFKTAPIAEDHETLLNGWTRARRDQPHVPGFWRRARRTTRRTPPGPVGEPRIVDMTADAVKHRRPKTIAGAPLRIGSGQTRPTRVRPCPVQNISWHSRVHPAPATSRPRLQGPPKNCPDLTTAV